MARAQVPGDNTGDGVVGIHKHTSAANSSERPGDSGQGRDAFLPLLVRLWGEHHTNPLFGRESWWFLSTSWGPTPQRFSLRSHTLIESPLKWMCWVRAEIKREGLKTVTANPPRCYITTTPDCSPAGGRQECSSIKQFIDGVAPLKPILFILV